MPTLTIQLPGLPPVDHILREEMMTIGRMKGNTIALDDASVSISHAKITRKGSEFFLKDLNSTNGTMLNGQSINEARLKDGDQLKFGEVIALYHSEPDFVSATPGQTPAAISAAPAPAPAAAPPAVSSIPAAPLPGGPSQPIVSSTSFISKRLMAQVSPAASMPPSATTALTGQTGQVARGNKKPASWLMPLAASAVVVVVVSGILLKFFIGGQPASKPSANSSPAAVPAVGKSGNSSTGNPARPVAAGASKSPAGASLDGKSVADLKKILRAANPVDRRRAAAALHGLGSGAKEALPELRTALADSDADVRMWAALALINNKSYDKAAIPILVQVLQNDNSMLRQVSCLSLALIPYEDADKDMVVTALFDTANKDGDEEVRKSAVSALKIIAPEVIAVGK